MPQTEHTQVAIVGAGLAGLACARTLTAAGIPSLVIEASDVVGGRVRTDEVEGPGGTYWLDRGFQVYLSAYPEGASVLDLKALDLCPFEPGAVIRHNNRFHTLMDPWRRPTSIFEGALAGVGSLTDKLKVGLLRAELQKLPSARDALTLGDRELTIDAFLRARGFSAEMIDRFFRPFFGGITFDLSLSSSARVMQFIFRCFSGGDACVPRMGMQRIPDQLAAGLDPASLRLNQRVLALAPGLVRTATTEYRARSIVLACEGPAARRLLGLPSARTWRRSTTAYFAFTGPAPLDKPVLLLDADLPGDLMNVAFMSTVSPTYAPASHGLVAVATPLHDLPDPELTPRLTRGLSSWFGEDFAKRLTPLRTYRITHALPDQTPPWMTTESCQPRIRPDLYRAGDELDTPSIDGALVSGRRAAEAILQDRSK